MVRSRASRTTCTPAACHRPVVPLRFAWLEAQSWTRSRGAPRRASSWKGTAGPAPPPGASLGRLPGGAAGNGQDTNDNLADTEAQASPIPEGRNSPPVPSPAESPLPTPTGTVEALPSPQPVPTAGATAPRRRQRWPPCRERHPAPP